MTRIEISHDYLKSILNYDPLTGIFTWKVRKSNKSYIGSVAAGKGSLGYYYIGVDKNVYPCHRLAWFYVYGVVPDGFIDHINGNILDNRIENLRNVDHYANMQNKKRVAKSNPSGYLGVSIVKKTGKYTAQIVVNRKKIHLGTFNTAKEANEIYIKNKIKLFPFYVHTELS